MAKFIRSIIETDTISLYEKTDGYWLWDETRKMNLAMHAESEQEAFIQTIEYFQNRLKEVEENYSVLHKKVDSFLNQFPKEDEGF